VGAGEFRARSFTSSKFFFQNQVNDHKDGGERAVCSELAEDRTRTARSKLAKDRIRTTCSERAARRKREVCGEVLIFF